MKLFLKKPVFFELNFNKYNATDETGRPVFKIRRKFFFFGCIQIYDSGNNCLGYLRERFSFMRPCFDLYFGDTYFGQLMGDKQFFSPNFLLDFQGWRIQGSFPDGYFRLVDITGQLVATAEEQRMRFGGGSVSIGPRTYEIYIPDPENAPYAVLIICALDMALHTAESDTAP